MPSPARRKFNIETMTTYPSVTRRYFATVIDLIVVIGLVTFLAKTMTALGRDDGYYWIAVLSPFYLYEPILTGLSATVGQRLFGFRVVLTATNKPIGILRALMRHVVKYLLGVISLLMIPADPQRRAIHDKAVDSVVVDSRGAD